MNFPNEHTETDDTRHGFRPLGRLLRSVDHLIARAFAEALAGEGADRRDWMLLNALSGDHRGHSDRLVALAHRKGKRLRALADRGWATRDDDGAWTLTDEGRAARDRLGVIVDGIRSRISGAVAPDQYATMVASLEAIARELGGDDASPWTWRDRGIRHGSGGNRHHGFGPGHGFAPGHGPHRAHGHRGHGRRAERAFERGFDAGFRRGREA